MTGGKHTHGFTIVELLIVIIVIGILAALVTTSYSSVQNRAHNTSVKNDLKAIGKKIQALSAESGVYPFPLTSAMGLQASKGSYDTNGRNNLYYCVNTTTNEFSLGATSRAGQGYTYSSTDGLVEESGLVWGADTCGHVGLPWDGAYGQYAYNASGTWSGWMK